MRFTFFLVFSVFIFQHLAGQNPIDARVYEKSNEIKNSTLLLAKDAEFAQKLDSGSILYMLFDVPVKQRQPLPEEIFALGSSRGESLKKADLDIKEDSLEMAWNEYNLRTLKIHTADSVRRDTNLVLHFLHQSIPISFDKRMSALNAGTLDEFTISSLWRSLATTDYSSVIIEISQVWRQYNLNDYGYLKLVSAFSTGVYPKDSRLSRILQWFLLVHSGYDARIGYYNDSAYLLIPSIQNIYGCKKLVTDKVNYYLLEDSPVTKLYTYPIRYSTNGAQLDFNVYYPLNLGSSLKTKTYVLEYKDVKHIISLNYDSAIIEFYRDYPQTELGVFFNAAVSGTTMRSIHETFDTLIRDLSPIEASNLLLTFVQKCFPYERDDKQFGREKILFPEEFIYYNGSDCDDRAVFYAWLVKTLVGLEVMGLEFAKHVAVAILLPEPQNGIGVTYQGNHFTVADPTLEDAPVGVFPGDFITDPPIRIQINQDAGYSKLSWEKSMQCLQMLPVYKCSCERSIIKSTEDLVIISGCESKPMTDTAENNDILGTLSTAFVARIDKPCKIAWMYRFQGEGISRPLSIAADKENNIIVMGMFKGSIRDSAKTLTSLEGKTDLFVASLTQEGKLRWIRQMNLDSLPSSLNLNFACQLDKEGKLIESWLFKSTETDYRSILGVTDDNKLNINVSLTGFPFPDSEFNYRGIVNPTEQALIIKNETDILIKNKAHPSVAGLIAVSNLLSKSGNTIMGESIKKALDKYNPGFKTRCPNMYASITRILQLSNDHGIIKITTVNGAQIKIQELKVKDNAKATFKLLANGDYHISFIDGAEVGKYLLFYNLNKIIVQFRTSTMTFDYGDHQITELNLQDLLK